MSRWFDVPQRRDAHVLGFPLTSSGCVSGTMTATGPRELALVPDQRWAPTTNLGTSPISLQQLVGNK